MLLQTLKESLPPDRNLPSVGLPATHIQLHLNRRTEASGPGRPPLSRLNQSEGGCEERGEPPIRLDASADGSQCFCGDDLEDNLFALGSKRRTTSTTRTIDSSDTPMEHPSVE